MKGLYNLNDYYRFTNKPFSLFIDNINFTDKTVSSIIFKDVLNDETNPIYNISSLNYYFISDNKEDYKFYFHHGECYNIFYLILRNLKPDINQLELKEDLNDYIDYHINYSLIEDETRPLLKNITFKEDEIKEIFQNRTFFNGNTTGKYGAKEFNLRG